MSASTFIPSAGGFAELKSRTGDAMGAWGDAVLGLAQSNAPVDTGYLRDHMYVLVFVDGSLVYGQGPEPEGMPRDGVVVVVANDAGYGRWVHDGTSDTAPDPFLQRALTAALPMLRGLAS